jgi:carbamoyl-phosphate synthase large subunit
VEALKSQRLTGSGIQRHRARAKAYGKPEYNIAYVYVKLGLGEDLGWNIEKIDLYPEEHYLIRQMDCGVILKYRDQVWRIA